MGHFVKWYIYIYICPLLEWAYWNTSPFAEGRFCFIMCPPGYTKKILPMLYVCEWMNKWLNEWMNKVNFCFSSLKSELTKARSPPNELSKFVRSPTKGTKKKDLHPLASSSLSPLFFSAHFGFLVAAVAAKAASWFYSQQPSFGASSPSGAQFATLSLSLSLPFAYSWIAYFASAIQTSRWWWCRLWYFCSCWT